MLWWPLRHDEVSRYDALSWARGWVMRRREFVAALGAAVSGWPLGGRAQEPTPTVGFLSGRSLHSDRHLVAAFRKGLAEMGYAEGQNVRFEFRWADGQFDRLPGLAAELTSKVSVLFAGAVDVRITDLSKEIRNLPLVLATGGDLVELGVVASINRPGGNATGITVQAAELWPKQLEIVRELLGPTELIALLFNPDNATAKASTRDVQAAAAAIKQSLVIIPSRNENEFDAAFSSANQQRAGAMLVAVDALFVNRRDRIVALAAASRIPAIYGRSEFPLAGGLISYGANNADQYRQSGIYVGRVLRGAKPADLPVLQPTKFELVINLSTAKTLGVTVPPTLLARADDVIE